MAVPPDVANAHALIHKPGQVVELRCIGTQVWTGTFREDKPLYENIDAAMQEPGMERIQWSINTIRDDYPVTNSLQPGGSAVGKADIAWRDYVYVDFDLKTGPSLDERDIAEPLRYLKGFGSSSPVIVSSGRGLNVLFKAGWKLAEETVDVAAFLKSLAIMFAGNARFAIDPATASPERGIRVPGTTNIKNGKTVTLIGAAETC
jgi:hypothetical protein